MNRKTIHSQNPVSIKSLAWYHRNKERLSPVRKKQAKAFYYRNKDRMRKEAVARYWKKKTTDPERFIKDRRAYIDSIMDQMINAYGGKCNCCSESERIFLTLDHIYNDGRVERIRFGGGLQTYLMLRKKGWPKDRYQLLCMNCNWGKQRNKGQCPHAARTFQIIQPKVVAL